MEGDIILAQAKEYTGFQPTTVTIAKEPEPSLGEKMAGDPALTIAGAILAVLVIGLVVYLKRRKAS